MIKRPKLQNSISFARRACVPITISTPPSLISCLTIFASFAETSRDNILTLMGNPESLSIKLR